MSLKRILHLSVKTAITAAIILFAVDVILILCSPAKNIPSPLALLLLFLFSACLFVTGGLLFGIIQGLLVRLSYSFSSLCKFLGQKKSQWWIPLFYTIVASPGIIYISLQLFHGRGIAKYPRIVNYGPFLVSMVLALLVAAATRLIVAGFHLLKASRGEKFFGRTSISLIPFIGAAVLAIANGRLYIGLYTYIHNTLTLLTFILVELFLLFTFANRWQKQVHTIRLWGYVSIGLAFILLLLTFPTWQKRDDLKVLVSRRTVNEEKLLKLLYYATAKDDVLDIINSLKTARSQVTSPGTAAEDWVFVPADTTNMNLIIITVDALRADHIGSYGYKRPTTPQIDKLAKNSFLFENAYQVSNNTTPSMRALFEVKLPHKIKRQSLGVNAPPLEFSKHGYRTISVNLADMEAPYVLEFNRYFETIMDTTPEQRAVMDDSIRTDVILEALHRYRNEKFLLWVDYTTPHEPYKPPAPFNRFGSKAIDRYDGEIAYTDHQIGRLLDGLAELGLQQKTIVALLADHGEEFLEHGGTRHGRVLYNEVIKVPLIIYVPTFKGKRINQEVSCLDLFPTLLNLAGLRPPREMDGVSLVPLMLDKGTHHRRAVYSQHINLWNWDLLKAAIIKDGWKLIYTVEGNQYELYDLNADPGEQDNLALTKPAKFRELSSALIFYRLQALQDRIIERINEPAIQRGLVAILEDNPDPAIRSFALQTLAKAPSGLPAELIETAMSDYSPSVRQQAIRNSGSLPTDERIKTLHTALNKESDNKTIGILLEQLAKIPGVLSTQELIEWSSHNSPNVSQKAVLTLGEIGDIEAEEILLSILTETPSKQSKFAAIDALGKMKSRKAVPLLEKLCLKNQDPLVADKAISALGIIGDKSSFPILDYYLLNYPEINIKRTAAKSLGHLGDRRALETFQKILPSANQYLRGCIWIATNALVKEGDDSYLIECYHLEPWNPPRNLIIGAMKKVGGADTFIFLCGKANRTQESKTREEVAQALEGIAKRLRWDEFIPLLPKAICTDIDGELEEAIGKTDDANCRETLCMVRDIFLEQCNRFPAKPIEPAKTIRELMSGGQAHWKRKLLQLRLSDWIENNSCSEELKSMPLPENILKGTTEPEFEQACIALCRQRKNTDDIPFLITLAGKCKKAEDHAAALETARTLAEAKDFNFSDPRAELIDWMKLNLPKQSRIVFIQELGFADFDLQDCGLKYIILPQMRKPLNCYWQEGANYVVTTDNFNFYEGMKTAKTLKHASREQAAILNEYNGYFNNFPVIKSFTPGEIPEGLAAIQYPTLQIRKVTSDFMQPIQIQNEYALPLEKMRRTGRVLYNPKAGLTFLSNSKVISPPLLFPEGSYRVSIDCSGTPVRGIYPKIRIAVENGRKTEIGNREIPHSTNRMERVSFHFDKPRTVKLSLEFYNDRVRKKGGQVIEDRNLRIKGIRVETIKPLQPVRRLPVSLAKQQSFSAGPNFWQRPLVRVVKPDRYR